MTRKFRNTKTNNKGNPDMTVMQPLNDSLNIDGHPGEAPWMHGIDVRIVNITPKLAHQWLGMNIGNRNKKNANIEKYARDLLHGNWTLTGETIIFDTNGHLRNGQNRLYACIKAGTAFKCLVVWGVAPEAFKNMDRGAPRSVADVLGVNGVENAASIAAAAGYLWRDENRYALAQGGNTTLTSDEAMDVVARHPGLADSVKWSRGSTKAGLTSPSLATYMHYKLSALDGGMADVFFETLYEAEGLYAGNPIKALVNQLRGTHRPRATPCAAYVFKTWNAWGAGKELKLIKWNGKVEDFPVPVAPTSQRWLLPAL